MQVESLGFRVAVCVGFECLYRVYVYLYIGEM